jgi:hypothetical protein
LFDVLVLTWIRLAHPLPSGSAHLFSINAGVSHCVELVLIWLLNCQDQIKVIKLLPWPIFPHVTCWANFLNQLQTWFRHIIK